MDLIRINSHGFFYETKQEEFFATKISDPHPTPSLLDESYNQLPLDQIMHPDHHRQLIIAYQSVNYEMHTDLMRK